MSEFFNVLPPDEARELFLKYIEPLDKSEVTPVSESLGRVTAEEVKAPNALPTFRRSTMDGYAVRSVDTFGASASLPAFLRVVGEVMMGEEGAINLLPDQASIIHTGGMLPDDADAVVQIEHTQSFSEGDTIKDRFEIEVFNAVAPGQNVIQVGEDVKEGEAILSEGQKVRPQDIGALLALGITDIRVTAQPLIGIMATGDEIIPPKHPLRPGQIRDINSYTVASLCQRAGGAPKVIGIVPDNYNSLKKAAESAVKEYDMLVISAGSSVSVRDITVDILSELGDPGILVHGVATKPGKPTILGAANGKPLIGLPGNPVSAMIQFIMFGVPAIHQLQGVRPLPSSKSIWARLEQNISSESGREDFIPAKIVEASGEIFTSPIFGKSNLIFTLVNADGLIKIPLNKGGVLAGEFVEVLLF
jgi:molybdopterin molybdotransferase